MMQQIFYIIGQTCAGKTTLMDWFKRPEYKDQIGFIEVGAEFRRRYPPEHFKGLGAPDNTEKEALEIYNEQLEANKSKRVILVSGQPRRLSQIEPTIGRNPGTVILLYASDEILERRANEREAGSRDLALKRIVNDKVQTYDVITRLMSLQYKIIVYDTGITPTEQIAKRIERIFVLTAYANLGQKSNCKLKNPLQPDACNCQSPIACENIDVRPFRPTE